jgi:DNA-binding transcriptional ArsR family regulator
MPKNSLKQWATVFRGLGNPNRLKILKILSQSEKVAVSSLAEELGISLKNTSRNLSILLNLDLVEFQGKHDRVYYSLNRNVAEEVRIILKVIL